MLGWSWRVLEIPPHGLTLCLFRRTNSSNPGGREVGITQHPFELSCVCPATLHSLPNAQAGWVSEQAQGLGGGACGSGKKRGPACKVGLSHASHPEALPWSLEQHLLETGLFASLSAGCRGRG